MTRNAGTLDRYRVLRRVRSVAAMDMSDGVLDEALERLHTTGPEREDWLSNHAPMVVESLARNGQAGAIHRWLDRYSERLEGPPRPHTRVTEANWREALGDPRLLADWADFFARQLTDHSWSEVLVTWWPRLLPGIAGAATHPVIRVGHVVRTLLTDGETAPRRAELGHALGYWAARFQALPEHSPEPAHGSAADSLDAVAADFEEHDDVHRLTRDGVRRLTRFAQLPEWPPGPLTGPEAAPERLKELVSAAAHRYASHGHGSPIMLVHAATAPNAVLRTLPALPPALWGPSVTAAWSASALITAAHGQAEEQNPPSADGLVAEEVFSLAAQHGDEHTIKFADTALDIGDELSLVAAQRAVRLNEPLA